MYKKNDSNQFSVYDFILPFGGHLDSNNRWVRLREEIDWELVDEVYQKHFDNKKEGNVAYPSDLAFASLYIQRSLKFTDRELVEQISENPYMQYFIGYKEYSSAKPFDASTLVYFRKRLTDEAMNEIIEKTFIKKDDNDKHNGSSGTGESNNNGKQDESDNSGTLIIDATCAPADIAYPTDLELCDKARKWTEVIFDHYWKIYGALNLENTTKPRTYRNKARQRFLGINKRKKKSKNKIRKELRYQLNCIKRNLAYIAEYEDVYGTDGLFNIEAARLITIKKFYEQQRYMLDNDVHSVDDRIVSLSQPWIRPIVRGKSKAPTEFGAKISISVVNGYTFIDKISFDAYNEGEYDEFVAVLENFKKRFGYYPKRVLADKIYRSHMNRTYCKDRGIKLSGPKLGRPGKNHYEELKQELKEIGERNEVEGKFGTAKRKLGLGLIMAKLKDTTGSMIGMDVFIINMERRMRVCASLLCTFLIFALKDFKYMKNGQLNSAFA